MKDSIHLLSSLVEVVERQGADIAPTYHEYMPMAFGIANACGEQGRTYFHRLCAPSARYVEKDADRLFDNALKDGRNHNSLGTVWHLAEQAGVELKGLLRPQEPETAGNCQAAISRRGLTYSRTDPYRDIAKLPADGDTFSSHTCAREGASEEEESRIMERMAEHGNRLPEGFPEYEWPEFLMQGVRCGETTAQRDILFMAQLAVYGQMLSPMLRFHYSHRTYHPCLQMFVMAPPASGKGVLGWVRHLGLPFHEQMIDEYHKAADEYETALLEWTNQGRQKTQSGKPNEPILKLHFVTGDNTGTGILENLINNGGKGIILESEADLLSAAINSDHGNWSHTLRKAFDHEGLAFNRRTGHEYRECKQTMLSVVLSGTPGQLRPLIPSSENGLFSRQLFYFMPRLHGWKDQFGEEQEDYAKRFRQWGERWKSFLEPLLRSVSSLRFVLREEQREEFNRVMESIYEHGITMYGDQMAGIVARIGVNLLRIASTVAFFRAVEPLLRSDGLKDDGSLARRLMDCEGLSAEEDIPEENRRDGIVPRFVLTPSGEDFRAVMRLAEPLYRHAAYVLLFLDEQEVTKRKMSKPDDFLSQLPVEFTRKEMLDRAAESEVSASMCDKMLRRFLEKGVLAKSKHGVYRFTSHPSEE